MGSKSEEFVSQHELDAANGDRDEMDMIRMGKVQQTRRMFGLFPLLGFTTIMLCSWETTFALFSTGFVNGGGPSLLYGYIFCFLGSLAVCASISEMASMYPTSGGQYHWIAILSPPRYSKFLSWIAGWLSVLGWQSGCASGSFLSGTIIQGLLVLNHPEYGYQRWHGTLIMYAIVLLGLFVNTILVRALPAIEGMILILHLLGFFAVLIPFVHLAPISAPSMVFQEWSNISNYADGLSFFVALTAGSVLFVGFDGACHMAEEVKNAAINVPRSMFFTIFLNGALGFAMYIAILFGIGDVNKAFNTPTGYPFITIFEGAMGKAGATALTSLLLALIIFATFGYLASASRQLWAFARDRAMPFSSTLAHIDHRLKIPIPAIAFTATFSFLAGLINIGSTVAFNAIVSTMVASLFTTYIISITLMVRKRRSVEGIKLGPWNLGGWGTPVNVIAVVYALIAMVFSFFPPMIPKKGLVEPESMNWSSPMFGGITLIGIAYYFLWARKVYDGPLMDRRFQDSSS